MATVINGVSYNAIASAFPGGASSPTAGSYYATPPLAESPGESAIKNNDLHISFAAINGVGRKRMNSIGREIYLTLVVCGTSVGDCESKKNAVISNIAGLARFSVTSDGGTARPGCVAIEGSVRSSKRFTMGTAVCCLIQMAFQQLSDSN